MSQQTINIGSAPNDGTGDPLRTAFTKCNSNFTELYTAVSPSSTVTSFNTRVGAITLSSLDVTNALTFTPLNKAGDTASGLITFTSGFVSNNLSTVTKNTGSLSVIPAAPTGTVVRAINVDGTVSRFNADSYVNAGSPSAGVTLRAARGTGAVPAAVIQGDILATISAHGYGATSFQTTSTGSIQFVAQGSGSFTDSSQPTGISFQVTPVSSVNKAEQVRLDSTGVLNVGVTTQTASTTPATGSLVVGGGVGVTGAINQGGSQALHNVNANAVTIGSLPASSTGTLLRLDNADTVSSVALLNSYNTAAGGNSTVWLRAARGTGASPSATQTGDVLGSLVGQGYGTSFNSTGNGTAGIVFVSEGVFNGTSQPTAISFQVTASGSIAVSEQMRLTSAGVLSIASGVASSSTSTGALVLTGSGGLGVGGAVNAAGIATFSNATASTTTSTGAVVVTGGVGIGGAVNAGGNVKTSGNYAAKAPVTNTAATYTQLASDNTIIFNTTATCTVTLLTPSTVPGQMLYLKNIAAQSVVSASSNVVALASATASTALFSAATAGKFTILQSDGTNWVILAQN